jgi:hypothetical protein
MKVATVTLIELSAGVVCFLVGGELAARAQGRADEELDGVRRCGSSTLKMDPALALKILLRFTILKFTITMHIMSTYVTKSQTTGLQCMYTTYNFLKVSWMS